MRSSSAGSGRNKESHANDSLISDHWISRQKERIEGAYLFDHSDEDKSDQASRPFSGENITTADSLTIK